MSYSGLGTDVDQRTEPNIQSPNFAALKNSSVGFESNKSKMVGIINSKLNEKGIKGSTLTATRTPQLSQVTKMPSTLY